MQPLENAKQDVTSLPTGRAENSRDPRLFPFFASVRSLPGVGPSLLASLRRLLDRDEPRVLDLLLQPPLAARSLEALDDVSLMADGAKVTLAVSIGRHSPSPPRSKAPYKVHAVTDDQSIDLVFFHAKGSYLAEQFPSDSKRLIHGRLGRYRDRWQMAHPEIVPDDPQARRRAALVYALSDGLTQIKLKKLIEHAIHSLDELPEWHASAGMSFKTALAVVHGASALGSPESARARLAADELLATQLALQLNRRITGEAAGRSLDIEGLLTRGLLSSLSFTPTNAQSRSMNEIRADMRSRSPMLRLLMGDVGSGKTLVALAAMLDAVEAGTQAVLMAPTEILARQHAALLQTMVLPLGLEVGLLVGGDPAKVRASIKSKLAEGVLRLAVGTHALFQEDVAIRELGLVVIDEQHRFGVKQRMDLIRKGRSVDLLLMSATPIPRSLVLARYGDIDISRLDEKPPGRQPIKTVAMPAERLDELIEAVDRAIEAGERVYWVCPVIEQALEQETPTAEDRYALLEKRFGDKVALLHGRLTPSAKDAAMQSFADGDTCLLVATTVIEVGVDVPEATIIVIDGAQHFGLAQLHQLRGRVGRGDRTSNAILLYSPPISRAARRRIAIMRESEDGFLIAEEDLNLRGPGEILGARQSGFATLKFADLAHDGDLIDQAKAQARALLASAPRLESPRGFAVRNLLQLFDYQIQQSWLDAG